MVKDSNVSIERISEGTTINCKSEIEDVVNAIIEEYRANEVCVGEVMASLSIHGLSIEEVAIVYAKVYKIIEEDKVIRIADGEEIDLAKDYD